MTLTKGKECKKCVNNYHCPEHCPYPEKCTDSDCAIARLNCHTPPPTEGIWMKPCRGCGKDIPATMDDIDHACPPPALPSDGLSQQKTCPTPTSEGWRERVSKVVGDSVKHLELKPWSIDLLPLFKLIEAELQKAREEEWRNCCHEKIKESELAWDNARTATLHDLQKKIEGRKESKSFPKNETKDLKETFEKYQQTGFVGGWKAALTDLSADISALLEDKE